jgi:hypothetical protein
MEQNKSAARKVGGSDVGSPSNNEVKAASRILPDGLSDTEAASAAFDIASQARALRKSNPGMSADDAMRQALAAKKDDFVTTNNPGFIENLTGGYSKLGSSTSTKYAPAIPVPTSKSKLVDGVRYRDSSGATAVWNAKTGKFQKTGAAPTKSVPSRSAPETASEAEGDDDQDE